MNSDPKLIVDQLKLEIRVLEHGGYSPSVREPHRQLRIFRDSVSCPNVSLQDKAFPCAHCWLAQFIPFEYVNAEEPCHYIPLNEKGDTVASLLEAGKPETALEELLRWLRRMVTDLESEISLPAAT